MMVVTQTIAPHMPEAEIIELHHDKKLDAPSGTAARTAELIDAAGGNVHRADPLGPPARPGRPPGSDLRRPRPDPLDPPRLDRPLVLHARRPARRAARSAICPILHRRAGEAPLVPAATARQSAAERYPGGDEGATRNLHGDGDAVRRVRRGRQRRRPPAGGAPARTRFERARDRRLDRRVPDPDRRRDDRASARGAQGGRRRRPPRRRHRHQRHPPLLRTDQDGRRRERRRLAGRRAVLQQAQSGGHPGPLRNGRRGRPGPADDHVQHPLAGDRQRRHGAAR